MPRSNGKPKTSKEWCLSRPNREWVNGECKRKTIYGNMKGTPKGGFGRGYGVKPKHTKSKSRSRK